MGEKVNNKIYKCKFCGKIFYDRYQLSGHATICECNPKRNQNLKNFEIGRKTAKSINNTKIYICNFCGREFNNNGARVVHENACQKNPNRKPHPNGDREYKNGRVAWNKGKTLLTDERILKYSKTRRENILNGSIEIKGKPHTEETKEKMRNIMIEYIKRNGNGQFGQHYSIKGCNYIDKLNKEKHWNLQHALNGGEKQVGGYFLDGYDEDLNIAFEYDEKLHYSDVYKNKLKEKDLKRQKYIIEKLGCRFFRYNEVLNLLYEVEY